MTFRERLTVPIIWWVLLAGFALSLLAAFLFYLGPVWGAGIFVLTGLVGGLLFWSASIVIEVGAEGLKVGRAWIEFDFLADAAPLDAAQTVRRRGAGADPRAYLVLRPYITTGVEITLKDPNDPVPYWLISSRHPTRLAEAVRGGLSGRLDDATGHPADQRPGSG